MVTKYRELIVKGDDEILKGFLWGYKFAKNYKKGLLFCDDHPIDTHHIREVLSFHRNWEHVIASEKVYEGILAALKGASEKLKFEIMCDKVIRDAHFEFEFETFSRDVARDLKRTLKRMPVSLELYDYDAKEEIDPGARGTELYSPVHDYCFKGKGKVRGGVEALLAMHAKLDEHVFIETSKIKLDH
jgi:hypothetical protein